MFLMGVYKKGSFSLNPFLYQAWGSKIIQQDSALETKYWRKSICGNTDSPVFSCTLSLSHTQIPLFMCPTCLPGLERSSWDLRGQKLPWPPVFPQEHCSETIDFRGPFSSVHKGTCHQVWLSKFHPGAHMEESENWDFQVVLWPPHMC